MDDDHEININAVILNIGPSDTKIWESKRCRSTNIHSSLIHQVANVQVGTPILINKSRSPWKISRNGSSLQAEYDEFGRLRIADWFLIPSKVEAFSENLGFVNTNIPLPTNEERDYAYFLWATFEGEGPGSGDSSRDRFFVHKQSICSDRSVYSETLKEKMEKCPSVFNPTIWLNGLITGSHYSLKTGDVLFFVTTPQGKLIFYPRSHRNSQNISEGTFVHVKAIPRRDLQLGGCQGEVKAFTIVSPPLQYYANAVRARFSIRCPSTVQRLNVDRKWHLMANEWIGLIAISANTRSDMQIGERWMIEAKKVKEFNVLKTYTCFWEGNAVKNLSIEEEMKENEMENEEMKEEENLERREEAWNEKVQKEEENEKENESMNVADSSIGGMEEIHRSMGLLSVVNGTEKLKTVEKKEEEEVEERRTKNVKKDEDEECLTGIVVTRATPTIAFVASTSSFQYDFVLYDCPSAFGKWITFRYNRTATHTGKYKVDNYAVIPDVYPKRKARRRGNNMEILVDCEYDGISKEDGRPILTSPMGQVLGSDRWMRQRGVYNAWISKFNSPNLRSRWIIIDIEEFSKEMRNELDEEKRRNDNSLPSGSQSSTSEHTKMNCQMKSKIRGVRISSSSSSSSLSSSSSSICSSSSTSTTTSDDENDDRKEYNDTRSSPPRGPSAPILPSPTLPPLPPSPSPLPSPTPPTTVRRPMFHSSSRNDSTN